MRTRRVRLAVALAVLASVAVGGVATAAAQEGRITGEDQVVGSPDLEVSVSDNRLPAGERVELTVTVSNSGDVRIGGPQPYERRVKTARNVRVSIPERSGVPIDVKTGTVVIGDVADGAPRKVTFVVETEENATMGSYDLPVRLEYDATRIVDYLSTTTPPGYANPRFRDFDRDVTRTAEVVFEPEPRFEIVSKKVSGLYAGDTGTLRLTVRNDGEIRARDATLRLESGSSSVGFGTLTARQTTASVSTPNIPVGGSATLSVGMAAGADTEPGSYPVTATVEYTNLNGVEEVSDGIPIQVPVGDERTFELRDIETEALRVGEDDAVLTGTVVNTGPATAHDATVIASSAGAITPTGPESAVGDLEPGGSAPVRFKFAVGEDAEPGNRSLAFEVKYENSEGEVRRANTPVRERVSVGEEVDTFEIVGVNASVNAGGSGTVRLRIRNTGGQTVRSANAKVFLNSPLSSSDNSAFLGEMEPGETKTAVFAASATGGAMQKEYDAALQVRYEDRTGETELADEMSFGLPVGSSSGGIPTVFVGAGVLVVLASAGVYYYRRER